jgi:hypothetical protein
MGKTIHTLNEKVLYDDASLYVAKEGEKLFFNFKRKPYCFDTYNVLEAVAVLIREPKYNKLPIWQLKLSNLDKTTTDSTTTALYWLSHPEEIENEFNIEWKDYNEKLSLIFNKTLLKILKESETLNDIKNSLHKELNFDIVLSQFLKFSV